LEETEGKGWQPVGSLGMNDEWTMDPTMERQPFRCASEARSLWTVGEETASFLIVSSEY
jgi:hypothetical protein